MNDVISMFFVLLRLIFAFGIGFILPGYLLSIILRQKGFDVLISSLLLSSLVLFYSILILAYSPLSANFANISILLLILSSLFLFIINRNKFLSLCVFRDLELKINDKTAFLIFLPFAILIFLRGFFQEMMSPDSIFRWGHLAELIFKKASLDFYPPVCIEDFSIYPYPDGFPPFVSSIYAFIYICAGHILRRATAVVVLVQFTICSYYVYKTSLLLFKDKICAQFSLAALLISPMFFFSVLVGQETGITALCSSGFFYYSLKASLEKSNKGYSLILASVCVALGAVCREYGIIFVILAPIILFLMEFQARDIFRVFTISLLVSLPFYLRNMIVFGNPFYPLSFFGFLAHNVVHQGIMDEYGRQFAIFAKSSFALEALIFALLGLPIQTLTFVIAWSERKKFLPFLMFASVIICLWVYSTKYTCGGIFYSMRVLSPAIVALCVPAGFIIANFAKRKRLVGQIFFFVFPLILLFSFLSSLTIPVDFFRIKPTRWLKIAFGEKKAFAEMIIKYTILLPNGSIVLSDSAIYSAYLHGKEETRVKLIPIWSPEFLFLFDENISFDEKMSFLRNIGVTHIMKTKESANNDFFERFAFFRDYPRRLHPIIEGHDSMIYLISEEK